MAYGSLRSIARNIERRMVREAGKDMWRNFRNEAKRRKAERRKAGDTKHAVVVASSEVR